jgi:hypothetical protein
MMLRFAGLAISACLVCCGGVWGQDAVKAAAKEKNNSAAKSVSTESVPETPKILPGDVIELKYGKTMSGVQILRETPKTVEVQTVKGVDPLMLPRGQIKDIKYDNVEASASGAANGTAAGGGNVSIMDGKELSPEFHEKLVAPLSKDALTLDNLPLVKIAGEIQRLSNVVIQLDPSVASIPTPETKRTFQIAPGVTLDAFLQNDFAKQYPQLSVEYRFDKVLISTKGAAAPKN